jgi:hypothetical protein
MLMTVAGLPADTCYQSRRLDQTPQPFAPVRVLVDSDGESLPVHQCSAKMQLLYPKRQSRMLKVMIAEDDLMMADMLEEVLVEGGYEVCGIARTVDNEVELGERHHPDLVVLELRLAEGGLGTEIAARLNRHGELGVSTRRVIWVIWV